MKQATLYILCDKANFQELEELKAFLGDTKFEVITSYQEKQIETIGQNEQNKLLCLLSDNFFKSLDLMRSLKDIIDVDMACLMLLSHGRRQKEGDEYEIYPTEIGTLKEVMTYRDYWYDEWIRLRKLTSSIEEEEKEAFEVLKISAKKVSINTASILRGVNNRALLLWEDLCRSNFQELQSALGIKQEELVVEHNEAYSNVEKVVLVEPVTNYKMQLIEGELVEEQLNVEESIVEAESIVEQKENEQLVEEKVLEAELEIEPAIEISPVDKPVVEVASKLEIVEEEDLNTVIEETRDIDILLQVADAELEASDFEQAEQCYLQILKIDPFNGRGRLALARLYARYFEDKKAEAEEEYKKALMFIDENPNIYYEYALFIKNEFKSYYKAIELFREVIHMDQYYATAHFELGLCQLEMGQLALAKASYLQACLLDSEGFSTKEYDAKFQVFRKIEKEPEVEEILEETQNPNTETTVLITGASSGIGKALAKKMALDGYKVIITGRRKERLEEFKATLEADYSEVQIETLCFDVRDLEACKSALATLPKAFNQIDMLINNAGLAKGREPIHQGKWSDWETMIDTNLKGLLYMTRLLSPGMVERKKGHIINVGSVAGKEVYANGNVYCATKAAVDALTQGMRIDLHQYGIKVAAVHPGHVETEFAEVRFEDKEKAKIYEDFHPLQAEDVAEVIYFLLTRPKHVNIQDVLMFSNQQASANIIDRSGR